MKSYRRYPKQYVRAAVDNTLKPSDITYQDALNMIESTSPDNMRAWKRYADSKNDTLIRELMNPDNRTQVPPTIRKYLKDKYGDCFGPYGSFNSSRFLTCTHEQLNNLVDLFIDESYSSELDAISKLSNLPEDILRKCANSAYYAVLDNICNNPSAPKDLVLDTLTKMASHDDDYTRALAARSENAPVSLLKKLAKDSDDSVVAGVVSNSNTPVDLILDIARTHDDPYILKNLCKNPNAPKDVVIDALEYLANTDNDYCEFAASHQAATPEILNKLSMNTKISVRQAVAKNLSTPIDTLSQLAKDKSAEVRKIAAENPNLPRDLIETLKEDISKYVREAAQRNTGAMNIDHFIDVIETGDSSQLNIMLTETTPLYALLLASGLRSREIAHPGRVYSWICQQIKKNPHMIDKLK